jgi:hypothetical protein
MRNAIFSSCDQLSSNSKSPSIFFFKSTIEWAQKLVPIGYLDCRQASQHCRITAAACMGASKTISHTTFHFLTSPFGWASLPEATIASPNLAPFIPFRACMHITFLAPRVVHNFEKNQHLNGSPLQPYNCKGNTKAMSRRGNNCKNT